MSTTLNFVTILTARNLELTKWSQAIDAEIEAGLSVKVADKLLTDICADLAKLEDARYEMPTEKKPTVKSFNFNISGVICSELAESLEDTSVIKNWIERIKEWNAEPNESQTKIAASDNVDLFIKKRVAAAIRDRESLRLNFSTWNIQLDKVAEKVVNILENKIEEIKKANTINGQAVLEFKITYSEKSEVGSSSWGSSGSFRADPHVLKVSFWAPAVNLTKVAAQPPEKTGFWPFS